MMDASFEALGLMPPLLRALDGASYDECTPIQKQAIPLLLDGYDLMGCAQTGTGKTAAFALPTLQRLALSKIGGEHSNVPASKGNGRTGPRPLRCLVLAPTRELAAQIGSSFNKYGKYLGLRVSVVHGGVSQAPQARTIERGVDILVATPGRLLDLMEQRVVHLSNVEILVIDEADQMFDMGFLRDLKRIVAKVPLDRQTLMFSATMPEPIRELANQWLYEPKSIEVAPASTPVEAIEQSVFCVSPSSKSKLLVSYIKSNAITRSIVFVRTKHGADQLVKVLGQSGIDAVAIHGNKSQNARTRHLAQFKSERPPILVATDIAARGIDVAGVSHVINFHMPDVPEAYVHRIGRTARAGCTGTAVSFCSPEELDSLRCIERLIRRKIEVNVSQPDLTLPAGSFASGSSESKSGASTARNRSPSRNGRASSRASATKRATRPASGHDPRGGRPKSKTKLVRK